MTTQMILALSITILMIVMIMSDNFSFGAPPMVACCLLVLSCALTGIGKVQSKTLPVQDSVTCRHHQCCHRQGTVAREGVIQQWLARMDE